MEKGTSKRTQRRLRLRLAHAAVLEERRQLESVKKIRVVEETEGDRVVLDPNGVQETTGSQPSSSPTESPDTADRLGSVEEHNSSPLDTSDAELSCSDSDFSRDLVGSGDDDLNIELSGEEIQSSSECDLSDTADILDEQQLNSSSSGSAPLYQHSCISSSDFNVTFLSLAQRHNLTYSSRTDILQLFSIVLPTPHVVPSSSNMLINKFANFRTETTVQHFCGSCTQPLSRGASCTSRGCLGSREQCAVFVRIPIATQISERFQGIMCIMYTVYKFVPQKP